MYSIPPSHVVVSSGAHAAGTITTNVIATPGAGFCLRILAFDISIARTTTGVVDETLQTTAPIVKWIMRGLQLTGISGRYIYIPEPGIQLEANVGLDLVSVSTLATGLSSCWVDYVIDTIS